MAGLNRKAKLSDYFALTIVALFFVWGFSCIQSCNETFDAVSTKSVATTETTWRIDDTEKEYIWEAINDEARFYVVNPESFSVNPEIQVAPTLGEPDKLVVTGYGEGRNRQNEKGWTEFCAFVRKLNDGGYEVLSIKFIGHDGEREWERREWER